MRFMLLTLLLVGLSACQSPPAEHVSLAALFTDHMVLQRDIPIPVWGKATPGGLVTVTLGDDQADAVAGEDSTWQVKLPAQRAGGPHELTVTGVTTLAFTNVMVGEVWIASGQSNMAWSLRQTNNAETEIAAANYPNIRLFEVANDVSALPLNDVTASTGWAPTTPETIAGFSSVAYFFGRALHDSLDIAVGLISTNWGGTRAEAWTSAETLLSLEDFREDIQRLSEMGDLQATLSEAQRAYETRLREWSEEGSSRDPGFTESPRWTSAEYDDSGWSTMDIPTLWEEAGMEGFDGFAWFRKTVDLPADVAEQDLTLHLGVIDDRDSTYVNGVLVGHTNQYNTPRSYVVDADLVQPGPNVITVRVLDTGGGGGLYGEPSELRLEPANGSGSMVSLAGPWRYEPVLDLTDLPQSAPAPQLQHTPSVLYNAMLAPLIPYAIRGAIWYQGESNAGRAYQYRELFPAMIEDWRTHWGQGDFPFYFVQLANFAPPAPGTWPELREAQTMALSLPNTGMAVTTDIGNPDDIHPRNKQDVGQRLALIALAEIHDQDLVYSGPMYSSMEIDSSQVRLSFDHVGGGLVAKDGPLQGFTIAGPDRVFVEANAEIDGETVIVSSPDVDEPVAIRYAWSNNPEEANLYNADGLPASSFRTDDWPGVTMGVK